MFSEIVCDNAGKLELIKYVILNFCLGNMSGPSCSFAFRNLPLWILNFF